MPRGPGSPWERRRYSSVPGKALPCLVDFGSQARKQGVSPWQVPPVTSLPRPDPAPARGREQSLGKDQKKAFHPEMKGQSHHPAVPSLPRDRRAQEDLGDQSHPVKGTSKGATLTQPCPVLPVTAKSPHLPCQVCDQPKQEEGHELTYKPSSGSSGSCSSGDTDLALGQSRARLSRVQAPGGWRQHQPQLPTKFKPSPCTNKTQFWCHACEPCSSLYLQRFVGSQYFPQPKVSRWG